MKKQIKLEKSHEIIAYLLNSDMIAVEFEVEIHDLRDRVIELKIM